MLIVAYYTKDTPYVGEAERFAKSCVAAGMRLYLEPYDDRGDWNLNTNIKPFFIQKCLRIFHEPVLYIDVDAVIHQNCNHYFDALQIDYDFACFWLEGKRLLSGTLYFNYTEQARKLLSIWLALNAWKQTKENDFSGGGQRNLWQVISDGTVSDLRSRRLPGRYCYAFRRPECYDDEPRIIEHLLASRENRDNSKGNTDPTRQKRITELKAEGF